MQAAKDTLLLINPGITIDAHNMDITSTDGYPHLMQQILEADLVLSCVDNYAARMSINLACLSLQKTWVESGVSETAMSSHV